MDCEFTMRLKQDREKGRAMFHTWIKLFPPTSVYVCIYYLSGHKWSINDPVKLELYSLQFYWKLTQTPEYFQNKMQLPLLVLYISKLFSSVR